MIFRRFLWNSFGRIRAKALRLGLWQKARDLTGARNFHRRKKSYDDQTKAQRRLNRIRILSEKNGQSQSKSKG